MEIGKHCIWGLLEIKNMKGIFSRQISDSPPAQGAPELISGLTRLCVCLFRPISSHFSFIYYSQINPTSPPKTSRMPPYEPRSVERTWKDFTVRYDNYILIIQ